LLITEPLDFELPEPLKLDCGKELKQVNIRYETAGKLSPAADNAVLVAHALSGNSHVCGRYSADDTKPGWWDDMVGPGKAIDTDKYFVICSNVIGSCAGSTGPRSIDPDTGKPYNLTFPVITIRDMVRAQKHLVEHLGIKRLLAVIGGSMGGMQALEWAINFPDMVDGVIPIATTSQLSPQSIAFDWVGREAIKNDPRWNGGDYASDQVPEGGLSTARMLAHITYLSDESMSRKFGRELQDTDRYSFDFKRDFAVESYLEHQGRRFVEFFDANSYFYITRAMDYFDMARRSGGDLSKTLSAAKATFLVISFSSDWLFPTAESLKIVSALLKNRLNVSFCEIQSGYGHDAFLLEVDALGRMVRDFLRNILEVRRG
jgi:homoserine O-acetyltransferase